MNLIDALAKGGHGYRFNTREDAVVLACSMDRFIIEPFHGVLRWATEADVRQYVDGRDDWKHEDRPTEHPSGGIVCRCTRRDDVGGMCWLSRDSAIHKTDSDNAEIAHAAHPFTTTDAQSGEPRG